jgi:osmotically-inducible protein OsmY
MKTDRQLHEDVIAELDWDRSINATDVKVSVSGGAVTLSGHLETLAEKSAVERAVQRVYGAKSVTLDLDVRLDPTHRRTDAEIATAVENTLHWQAQVPNQSIHARVEHGWVTLTGEVDWIVQRQHAEKAVRLLTGVVGVHNKIRLRPSIVPDDVVDRIREAFKRHAEREVNHIHVEANGSVIVLRGTADSWAERRVAYGAAMSVPGVTEVINEIKVGR